MTDRYDRNLSVRKNKNKKILFMPTAKEKGWIMKRIEEFLKYQKCSIELAIKEPLQYSIEESVRNQTNPPMI